MLHLRIVSEPTRTEAVAELLERDDATTNVVVLAGACRQPAGDLVLCDVANEDASLLLADLRALGVTEDGAIAVERVELADSPAARRATKDAPGEESDAVVWEAVQARSREESRVSWSYVTFMALAAAIALSGLMTDSAILIVGAMVVSPDFGPLAGLCVAVDARRGSEARAALITTAVGLVIAIGVAAALAELIVQLDLTPDAFDFDRGLSSIISRPDAFTVITALAAGAAGMLSLLTAKSGALVGVLISVTTIPASAQIGLAAAFREWDSAGGAAVQLASNVVLVVLAGSATLLVVRASYARRRRRHQAGRAARPSE
ncbi:DUF389 domain-containing protein [Patulibacter minatonensis]|uniref:DUF389 domain-containing protein n=1 Tax=Patulibacter minatonensis TaxID=298163 RepID=UPI00047CF67F|nr:DUF389 domain-containing protein [Patulibacter minatonensis]